MENISGDSLSDFILRDISERIILSRDVSFPRVWKESAAQYSKPKTNKKICSGRSSWHFLQNWNSEILFIEKMFHFKLLSRLLRPSLFLKILHILKSKLLGILSKEHLGQIEDLVSRFRTISRLFLSFWDVRMYFSVEFESCEIQIASPG